jgi:hypothetical protein
VESKNPCQNKVLYVVGRAGSHFDKRQYVEEELAWGSCCYFCDQAENMEHLFFQCRVTRVVWGVIATCFGQDNRPSSYSQYSKWISKALPGGEAFYMFGIAAIYWATWKSCNRACIEKKVIKDLCEILQCACAYMHFWTGLYEEGAQKLLKDGVEVMMKTTLKLLWKEEGHSHPAILGPEAEAKDDDGPAADL